MQTVQLQTAQIDAVLVVGFRKDLQHAESVDHPIKGCPK
jgi:hypothetical protein